MNDYAGESGGGLPAGTSAAFVGQLDGELAKLKEAMAAAGREFPGELADMEGAPYSSDSMPDGQGSSASDEATDEEINSFVHSLIDKLFEPWRLMPDPAMFEGAGSGVRDAISGIAEVNSDAVSDQLKDEVPAGWDTEPSNDQVFKASAAIPQWGTMVQLNLQDWRGATVDSFEKNYTNRFPDIHNVQAAVGKVLAIAAETEAEIWTKAQEDILTLVKEAAYAFDELDIFGGDGNVKLGLTVLGAAMGALATISGPVGVIFAVAGATATISGEFIEDKQESGSYSLDASRIALLWDQVVKASDSIRDEIGLSEGKVYEALIATYGALSTGKVVVGKSGDGEEILVDCMDILAPPAPTNMGDVERPLAGTTPF